MTHSHRPVLDTKVLWALNCLLPGLGNICALGSEAFSPPVPFPVIIVLLVADIVLLPGLLVQWLVAGAGMSIMATAQINKRKALGLTGKSKQPSEVTSNAAESYAAKLTLHRLQETEERLEKDRDQRQKVARQTTQKAISDREVADTERQAAFASSIISGSAAPGTAQAAKTKLPPVPATAAKANASKPQPANPAEQRELAPGEVNMTFGLPNYKFGLDP